MSKLALFLIILVLSSPFSVSAWSIYPPEQTEQTEVTFEVLSKPRQQKSILALRNYVQKSNVFSGLGTLILINGVSSRCANNSTPIYLRKCTLLI